MSKKVFVMMSGGVDSSVAALCLQQQGYEVIGVFIKCWSVQALESFGANKDLYGCAWEEDAEDAGSVAAKLGIPFFVWDFEEVYKQEVVDYMLKEYQQGRTPNPDVMCNSTIKFGIFYKRAMELGADFVATGHYAKKLENPNFNWQFLSNSAIARGLDTNKDQSYFLWRVGADRIAKTLFPIGEFATKAEVRELAQKYDLLTANKPDSQGLCFIGQTPLRELLLQVLGSKTGEILEVSTNRVLGQHQGAFLYTVGQRNGLGLAGGPWFVSKIDVDKNQVWVTHQEQEEVLYSQKITIKNLNLFINLSVGESFVGQAQIRYRQTGQTATLVLLEPDLAEVTFDELVRAVSKGQSLVFYQQDVIVLGGVIS